MAHPKDKTETLRHDFEKAVAGYVAAFLKQFELDEHCCWWVGDRVGLDVFCFEDISAISLSDMIFCVENGVTRKEFFEHEEYCVKCHEYNMHVMNLESWHKGCPRYDFSKLDAIKADLDEEIKNVQESVLSV